ncbi:MAG: DEAD/DEAH box helicase [Microthrixaceae bacterium]
MSFPSAAASLDAAPTFESLGVPADVAASLAARAIVAPFPIQTATIPAALAGRDVCGRAPTGAGKTLAFGIPLMQRVRRARPGRPTALVLAPTRELAAQIADELVQLVDHEQTVAAFYGGVGFGAQLKALRRGVDVVVACPGRLADLISQGHVSMGDVSLVVLDEADRMADMGFLPEVRRLLDACAPRRQTLLFSATLDGDVDVIIKRYLNDPVRHEEAGGDSDGPVAEHIFWSVERTERVDLVARVVEHAGPTVVFCRTKRGADRVARQLSTRGVSAAAIHGDRSQNQRERALEDFRSGRARAIVATDVAARGIHVDGVACVVHYDPSDDPKDYVHRSGRTGRAGAAGTVISLVAKEQRKDLVRQQRDLGREIRVEAPDVEAVPEGDPIEVVPVPRQRSNGGGAGRPAGRSDGRQGRPARSRRRRPGAGQQSRSQEGKGQEPRGDRRPAQKAQGRSSGAKSRSQSVSSN